MTSIDDLDRAVLGQTLVNFVIAAKRLGHSNLRSTCRYVHPPLHPEAEFLLDIFTGTHMRDLTARWVPPFSASETHVISTVDTGVVAS